jgi:hypothetical protein
MVLVITMYSVCVCKCGCECGCVVDSIQSHCALYSWILEQEWKGCYKTGSSLGVWFNQLRNTMSLMQTNVYQEDIGSRHATGKLDVKQKDKNHILNALMLVCLLLLTWE